MINKLQYTTLFVFFLTCSLFCFSQNDTAKKLVPIDTLVKNSPTIQDKALADSLKNAFRPGKATIRSAIIPGWGQIYVRKGMKGSFIKKYWKIPVIYGALGISAGVFIYNLKYYRDFRFAYSAKYRYSQSGATKQDTIDFNNINPELMPYDIGSLRTFRDEFRSNIDYSALFFVLIWGLNVVDATVDAHLKTFDVSPDLSFKFKFGPSQMAGTTGLSLVLGVKNKSDYKPRMLCVR